MSTKKKLIVGVVVLVAAILFSVFVVPRNRDIPVTEETTRESHRQRAGHGNILLRSILPTMTLSLRAKCLVGPCGGLVLPCKIFYFYVDFDSVIVYTVVNDFS